VTVDFLTVLEQLHEERRRLVTVDVGALAQGTAVGEVVDVVDVDVLAEINVVD
jgi:hypothetical protein